MGRQFWLIRACMISFSPSLICHPLFPISQDKIASTAFKIECYTIYFRCLHCTASEALFTLKTLSLIYRYFLLKIFSWWFITFYFLLHHIIGVLTWIKSRTHHGVAISLAELNGISVCCRHGKPFKVRHIKRFKKLSLLSLGCKLP